MCITSKADSRPMKPVGKEVSAVTVYPTSYRQSFLCTFSQTRQDMM